MIGLNYGLSNLIHLKTVSLLISNKRNTKNHIDTPLILDGEISKNVGQHKPLGIIINSKLNWTDHINYIYERSMKRLDAIRHFKYKFNRKTLEIVYFSFVRPIMEYGQILFAGTFQKDLDKINKVEKEAMRIVTGATRGCSIALLNIESKWEDIATRRKNALLIMFYKIVNGDAPVNLLNIYNYILYENRGRNN